MIEENREIIQAQGKSHTFQNRTLTCGVTPSTDKWEDRINLGRAGEITQWQRVGIALSEGLNSIPRTHIRGLINAC